MYHDSQATFSPSNGNLPVILEFEVTDNYLTQLLTTGKLKIWWIENKNLLFMFNPASFTNQICISFDISSDETTLAVMTGSKNIHLFNLSSNGAVILTMNISAYINFKKISLGRG
jgi:hypothetical protein